MEPRQIKFTIPGKPTPLARPRMKWGLVYDAQKEEKHQFKLQILAQRKLPILQKPLMLSVTFCMPFPRKISKKNRTLLEGSTHHMRPDLDNLVKFVCDCLNEVAIKDDAIVSVLLAKKIYSTNPRTEFTLTEIQS